MISFSPKAVGVAAGLAIGGIATGVAINHATSNSKLAIGGEAAAALGLGVAAKLLPSARLGLAAGAVGLALGSALGGVNALRGGGAPAATPRPTGDTSPHAPATAESVTPRSELLPNIVPLAPNNFTITGSAQNRHLQFGTFTSNLGEGPLELTLPNAGGIVKQNIYSTDGSMRSHDIPRDGMGGTNGGSTNRLGFDDFAQYTLMKANADGSPSTEIISSHPKMSFLIIDTTDIASSYIDPTGARQVQRNQPGLTVQGISPGKADQYGPGLCGQDFDITGLKDGDYIVRQQLDPHNLFVESDERDNTRDTLIRIQDGTARVIKSGPPTTGALNSAKATQ